MSEARGVLLSAWSNLWSKFGRSKPYREAFVASQLKRGIPTQIRLLLRQRGWTQADLAERSGLTQGAVSRACNPDYGNLTFNNVLRIAAGLDVAFIGKFVSFGELASWHTDLSEDHLRVDSFAEEDASQKAPPRQQATTLLDMPRFRCSAPQMEMPILSTSQTTIHLSSSQVQEQVVIQ